MFLRRKANQTVLGDLDNVVWYGRSKDAKREVTQWMRPEFYELWEDALRDAFDLLGMLDRFRDIISDSQRAAAEDFHGLKPVPGWKNRHLMRRVMSDVGPATTMLRKVQMKDDVAVCFIGEMKDAMDQWCTLTELFGQATAMTIVTEGLRYYVQGTQVGYSPSTRHLFRRSNKVERIGLPDKPHWRANISGYQITILADWHELWKVHKENGYNLFQLLQLRLNEELDKAIQQGV
jgi:hypothetical protein